MENRKIYTPPLEKLSKEIEKTGNIVVLKGNEGSGKTTFQEYLKTQNFTNQTCTIFSEFLPDEMEVQEYKDNPEVLEHFYELKMTQMMLQFLSENHLTSLRDIAIAKKFRHHLEKLKNRDVSSCKKTGNYTEEILGKLHEEYPENHLFIDNYDEYAKKYPSFHKYMKRYFPYFSKVLLTSKEDIESTYSSIPVRYGTELHTTKEIIVQSLEQLNEQSEKQFDISKIDLETFGYINRQAKGNIDIIKNAILQFFYSDNWTNANETLKEALDTEIRKRKLTK